MKLKFLIALFVAFSFSAAAADKIIVISDEAPGTAEYTTDDDDDFVRSDSDLLTVNNTVGNGGTANVSAITTADGNLSIFLSGTGTVTTSGNVGSTGLGDVEISSGSGGTLTVGGGISSNTGNLEITNSGTITSATSISASNGIGGGGNLTITNESGGTLTVQAKDRNLNGFSADGDISITNSGTINYDGNVTPVVASSVITIINNAGGSISPVDEEDSGGFFMGTNSTSAFTVNGGDVSVGSIEIGHASQKVTFSGGSFSGDITPNSDGYSLDSGGVVAVNGTVDLSGAAFGRSPDPEIEGDNGAYLASFTVSAGSGGVVTLGEGRIRANSIAINSGKLVFAASSEGFGGTTTISESGGVDTIIDVGSNDISSESAITFNANTGLNFTISSSTSSGNFISEGAITIPSTLKLGITVSDSVLQSITSETSFFTVGGLSGSNDISQIAAENIDVNGTGSNIVGRFIISTTVGNSTIEGVGELNGLNTVVTPQTATAFSSNNNITEAGLKNGVTAIDNATNLSGELLTVSNYIFATNNITSAQRKEVLESVAPNDVAINQNTFNIVRETINVVENRIGSVRSNMIRASLEDQSNYKIVDKGGKKTKGAASSATAFTSGYGTDAGQYDSSKNYGIWAQVMTNSSEQKNEKGYAGYDSDMFGLTFGGDFKTSKSSILGAAFTIANSTIEASSNTKRNVVDSYQFNIYGEKLFNNKYFIDGFVSAAHNRYSSSRNIALVGKNARAHYNGETYSGKIKGGMINRIGKLEITPEIGAFYSHNSVSRYTEDGAGTANLDVAATYAEMFEGTFGLNFAYNRLEFGNIAILPTIGASYGYDLIGDEQNVAANFVGQATAFNSQTSKANRRIMRYNASLDIFAGESFSVTAAYLLETREEFTSQTGLFKARYEF